MKRTLLVTAALIAQIALNAQTAQTAQAAELPRKFVGGWCAVALTWTDNDTWSNSTYRRMKRGACKDDYMQLRTGGYVEGLDGEPITCRFVAVRYVSQDYFAVTARCQAEESEWYTEQMEFYLTGPEALTGRVKLRGVQ